MNNFKIIVDKRTELMSIILALAGGNDYIEEHFVLLTKDDYMQRVLKYFNKFKNHSAVLNAKNIAQNDVGFSFDNPILLAFQLQEDLTFDGVIAESILKELSNENELKEFLYSVEDFAKISKFVDFYNNEKNYYWTKIQEIEEIFTPEQFLMVLQQTLKVEIENNFIINIITTLVNSNHGFKLEGDIVANLGLMCLNSIETVKFDKGFSHIIIHEFLHAFVNPLTAKSLEYINSTLDLQPKSKMAKLGYGNKISYINDSIVRALTIRIREKMTNIDAGNFLTKEENWGFVHVQDIYREILKFEKQDLIWDKYFVNLLKVFEDEKEAYK